MPNGEVRHVNASNLLCQRLDLYVGGRIETLAEIVELALHHATEMGGEFDESLRYEIADLDRRT